ncbi:MAG: glycerate kinase [Thaumarchaeota archaeon]|nr:glycerate kinase [Nitrososphaerota archaeon]
MYIKNAPDLIDNGQTKAERVARGVSLDAIEAALASVEPGRLMRSKLRVRDDQLIVEGRKIDLSRFRRILVIGGGKAAAPMAEALGSLLGSRITAGIVNAPSSQLAGREMIRVGAVKLHRATHPLPSKDGQEGVREMLDLVGTPTPDDLVICLISGGGSSLMPMPREGVSLEDKMDVTRSLLRAGVTIQELNVVRKHLSALKGGWLAERLYPAVVLSLVISDVVGNRLDSIASGPLYPDPSTFGDATRILRRYNLWESIPSGVAAVIRKGVDGKIPETPKPGSRFFRKVSNVIIGGNEDACNAAVRRLRSAGQRPTLLTTSCEGEARFAGMFLGSILVYAGTRTRPTSRVVGGETTVTVGGLGRGGRNQEFALGTALKIDGNRGVAMVSIGTDGLDGSTEAAGAVVDGSTIRRAASLGLSPEEILAQNDTFRFFEKLGDLVMTGPTGTNVNDISVSVIAV